MPPFKNSHLLVVLGVVLLLLLLQAVLRWGPLLLRYDALHTLPLGCFLSKQCLNLQQ